MNRFISEGKFDRLSAAVRTSDRPSRRRSTTAAQISSSPQSRWDSAVEWLMAWLLAFSPLAFGATEAWSREFVMATAAVLMLCLLARQMNDTLVQPIWTWAYVPLLLFLALVGVQLLPLPAAMLKLISPHTVSLRHDLLADSAGVPDRGSLSLYPYATRQELGTLLAVCGVFITVINVYRDPARLRRLLCVISAVGLAIALMALYQNISGSTMIYGLIPAADPNCGPFMNYSHFGQFMNLSVGASVGLVLMQLSEMYNRQLDWRDVGQELLSPSSWMIWVAGTTCVLGPITVFLSMTRMGMLSMLAAGIVTASMFAWRGRLAGRDSMIAAVAICVFCGLTFAGFDATYNRLATLRHVDRVEGGRWQMLRDMTTEFRQFPLAGTGLGTHAFVFPMFDHSSIAQIASHAENEYAQLMEESGVAGVAMAMTFMGIVLVSLARTIWKPRQSVQYAAFGLGFGLLAILLHSASDFGEHVPANAFLTATFSALLINLSSIGNWNARRPMAILKSLSPVAKQQIKRLGRFAAFVVVLGGGGLAIASADASRRAESDWDQVAVAESMMQANNWQGSDDDYADLITTAAQASNLQPDNVYYRYWLNVYRWEAIKRSIDSATGQLDLTGEQVSWVARLVDELNAAHALCPTYGPPLCVAGQLEYFVLDRPIGVSHIRQAAALTPYDSSICYIEGTLAASQKNWDESVRAFSRSITLGGDPKPVIDDYVGAGRPDLAYQIATGDGDRLIYLANDLANDPLQSALANQCRNDATALLASQADDADASPELLITLADAYTAQGKTNQSIDLYRRALDLNYGQVDWRMHLACALESAGRYPEAMQQAQIALRLRPESKDAEALINDLSVRTPAADTAVNPSSPGDSNNGGNSNNGGAANGAASDNNGGAAGNAAAKD